MNGYDGPTLRSLREKHGVPLRKVARMASMSHGHLSKVERAEAGRPVTPAVLRAYEQATGEKLTMAAGHARVGQDEGWRRGMLSNARRATLNATIAGVATGGPLSEPVGRILDSTGRILAPGRVDEVDVTAVQQATAMCTELDLRFGGEVCDQQTRAVLRWAVGLLPAEAPERISMRLHAAVGGLAQRAAWSAFDADSHEVARSLFRIALFAAVCADDADLRGHVLADLAAQYSYLGYCDDALRVARLGEVDERVSPAVRMVIYGVKARAYGLKGDAEACRRHVDLAEQVQARAAATDNNTGWLAMIATEAQLAAACGHAMAVLARRTGSAHAQAEAQQRLTTAADQLGSRRRRAIGLCLAQSAALHLEAGELEHGARQARRALEAATGVRSARLIDQLAMVRTAAVAHAEEPGMRELVVDLAPVVEPPAGATPPVAATAGRTQ